MTFIIEHDRNGGRKVGKKMKKTAGILFIISVLFCGISFILMTPVGILVLIGISEHYGEAVMFRFWGISWFMPWILTGMLFWYLGPKNVEEVVDRFDRFISTVGD